MVKLQVIFKSQPTFTKALGLFKKLQCKKNKVYLVPQIRHLPKVIFKNFGLISPFRYIRLKGYSIYALGYIGAKLLCNEF